MSLEHDRKLNRCLAYETSINNTIKIILQPIKLPESIYKEKAKVNKELNIRRELISRIKAMHFNNMFVPTASQGTGTNH